ncbi:hypothetical protein [Parasitella parasitica]|uniref:Uncharacterized protein n=1 Tax=Parasitella parasitica TaxID=35722 RepID=A0A0B7NJ60_9FUNG|nr:hypothetical protein [Parasitella parasitica]
MNLPKKDKDLDAPSYSTTVSTHAGDFDVILSAMSPKELYLQVPLVRLFLKLHQTLTRVLLLLKHLAKLILTTRKYPRKFKRRLISEKNLKKSKKRSKTHPNPRNVPLVAEPTMQYPPAKTVPNASKERRRHSRILARLLRLINCCKYESVVSEIQKLVAHITQVVFAGSIFANYCYLVQVQNKEVPSEIDQNLIYQLFSVLTGQGKKAIDELQACLKKFCQSLPDSLDLNTYKGQGYSTVIYSMAKQYETLVRENISSNYESRTCRYLLGIFSKPNHELFCSNILTFARRKSIACYVFQKKANAEECKWPSSVDKNDENNSLLERTLAFLTTRMGEPGDDCYVLGIDIIGLSAFVYSVYQYEDIIVAAKVEEDNMFLPGVVDDLEDLVFGTL